MAILFYGGVSSDPDYMRQVYSTKRPKQSFQSTLGYANAEFDELADRQLVTVDDAERFRIVARMQEIVAADLPILPLWYPIPFQVYRRSVFDEWSYEYGSGGPYNKQVLVTGVDTGGLDIRPIKEEG
jgi:peptide/nickel transport system substrate-binding protein